MYGKSLTRCIAERIWFSSQREEFVARCIGIMVDNACSTEGAWSITRTSLFRNIGDFCCGLSTINVLPQSNKTAVARFFKIFHSFQGPLFGKRWRFRYCCEYSRRRPQFGCLPRGCREKENPGIFRRRYRLRAGKSQGRG